MGLRSAVGFFSIRPQLGRRIRPFKTSTFQCRAGPGRRIVILCDGTSNRPDNHPDGESIATNVWKLSGFFRDDDTQTIWYEAGVGSDSSSTAVRAKRTQYLLSTDGICAGNENLCRPRDAYQAYRKRIRRRHKRDDRKRLQDDRAPVSARRPDLPHRLLARCLRGSMHRRRDLALRAPARRV